MCRDPEVGNRKTTEEKILDLRSRVDHVLCDEDVEGSHGHAGNLKLREVNIIK